MTDKRHTFAGDKSRMAAEEEINKGLGNTVLAMGRNQAQMTSQWKPIETAPKDGTQILVGAPGWVNAATWGETKYHGAGWLDDCDLAHADSYTARPLSQPTHWMPLPPPPQDDAQ